MEENLDSMNIDDLSPSITKDNSMEDPKSSTEALISKNRFDEAEISNKEEQEKFI